MTNVPDDQDRPAKPPQIISQEVVEHGQKPDPRTELRADG